jgi:hypothetical protein
MRITGRMKSWDVWTAHVGHGPHSVVIVSTASRVTLKPEVVVLTCSSHRSQRAPSEHEMILDEEEGLDWPHVVPVRLALYLGQIERVVIQRELVSFLCVLRGLCA